jgi:Family of unknown function (DUF5670)
MCAGEQSIPAAKGTMAATMDGPQNRLLRDGAHQVSTGLEYFMPRNPLLKQRILAMLYTIAVVLLVLWLLGLVTSYTIGGFIHVLLVIAIVVVLLRIINGQKPV